MNGILVSTIVAIAGLVPTAAQHDDADLINAYQAAQQASIEFHELAQSAQPSDGPLIIAKWNEVVALWTDFEEAVEIRRLDDLPYTNDTFDPWYDEVHLRIGETGINVLPSLESVLDDTTYDWMLDEVASEYATYTSTVPGDDLDGLAIATYRRAGILFKQASRAEGDGNSDAALQIWRAAADMLRETLEAIDAAGVGEDGQYAVNNVGVLTTRLLEATQHASGDEALSQLAPEAYDGFGISVGLARMPVITRA